MAISTPNTALSANDARILNALFDPETLPSSVAKFRDESSIDTTLSPLPSLSAPQLAALEASQNAIIASVTNTSTPETIAAAIADIDATATANPLYPSPLVNRAMLRRLALEAELPVDGPTIFSHPPAALAPLFDDLARALLLSAPASVAPVSAYQARILRTAFSHRAYLYLKAAEARAAVEGLGAAELEERASRDFAAAARYGDEVAREMSVRTNPYAKMCGAIVRNALKEEREESGMV
jgi:hypothetical protein